jgi:conjugative relaxase-like TrwC/TraI family protein
MLSTSPIKNASSAGHYYGVSDNYYTREEGIEQSEWVGKGAANLGLKGEVQPELFTASLEGRLPNGELLGTIVDNKMKHRPGWDLTFSAPKSVSVLALIGGDKRLIEAHSKAVKVALSHIEAGCSQARIKKHGKITFQNTGNMVAALYHHDLSRAQDPQLHTHSIVMNMTQREDGKWRSQASQIGRYDKQTTHEVNGFIERARNNKRFYGKIYEAELAYQVEKLGYKIIVNNKTGVFEIESVPEKVNAFFSKRRQQITQALSESGLSGPNAASVAAKNTRENKKVVDRVSLQQEWQHQAKDLGVDCASLVNSAIDTLKTNVSVHAAMHEKANQILDSGTTNLVTLAVKELAQFKSSFTLEEVITHAFEYNVDNKVDTQSIIQMFKQACEVGDLIEITTASGKTVVMAKETLADEKRMLSGMNNQTPISNFINEHKLQRHINKLSDNPEVKSQLNSIFNPDRTIIIEGDTAKNNLGTKTK